MTSSCKKDVEDPGWEAEYLIPLANGEVSLDDIIGSDSTFSTDNEGSLSIVYSEKIYEYQNPLDSLVKLNIAPFEREVTISSLELSAQNVADTFYFKTLLRSFGYDPKYFENPTIQGFILAGLSPIQLDPISIDVTEFLESADLISGFIDIRIDNTMPVNFTEIDFEIRNTESQEVIFAEVYTDLNQDEVLVDLDNSLAGKTVSGKLEMIFNNVEFEPVTMGTIPIDTFDYLSMNVSIRDIDVSGATAIFPAQEIVNETDTVGLRDIEDVELTYAKIKSGRVDFRVFSTIPTRIYFDYEIPSATLNGETFKFHSEIPKAPPEGLVYESTLSFEGYDLDLTGMDGTLVNTFFNTVKGQIDSTGELISLTLEDTISIELEVNDLMPSYVEGFLGQSSELIALDSTAIEGLPDEFSEGLSFGSSKITLRVENGLGMSASADLTRLESMNSKSLESVAYPNTPIHLDISSASNSVRGETFEAVTSKLELEDATDLLNILPDLVAYAGNVEINPNGNNPAHSNFFYDNSFMEAWIDLNIPLDIGLNEVKIRDTLDFDLEGLKEQEVVTSGQLVVIADNSFPAEFNIQLTQLNGQKFGYDTLYTTDLIQAATVGSSGKVETPTRSILRYTLNEEQVNALHSTDYLAVEITVNTTPANETFQFYSDYSIKLQISGDLKVHFDPGIE